MFTSQQTPADGSSPFAVSYLAPNYLTLFFLWIAICEATAFVGRFLIVRVKNWAHVRQLGEHLLTATNGMTEEAKAFAASVSDEKIASAVVVANLPAAVSHGIVGVLCLPVCVHGWRADAFGTTRGGGGPISVFRTPEYVENGEWERLFVLGMMFDTALNLYDVAKSFVCFEKFGFWKKVDALREKSPRVWGFLIPCHFALPVSIVPVIVTILHHSLAIVLVPFVSKNGHILQLAELHLLYVTMTLLGPIPLFAEVVKQVQDLHTERGFLIFRICAVLRPRSAAGRRHLLRCFPVAEVLRFVFRVCHHDGDDGAAGVFGFADFYVHRGRLPRRAPHAREKQDRGGESVAENRGGESKPGGARPHSTDGARGGGEVEPDLPIYVLRRTSGERE